jgi:hypothetical protein
MHLDWSGRLFKDQDQIKGEADYTWTRKYWYSPIGLGRVFKLVYPSKNAIALRCIDESRRLKYRAVGEVKTATAT